jgi:hypothetical protein
MLTALAALGGLAAGVLLAAVWTAGCRQGRNDILSAARALDRGAEDRPRLAAIAKRDLTP